MIPRSLSTDPYPRLRAYLREKDIAIYDPVIVEKRKRTSWVRLESHLVASVRLKIETIREAFPDAEFQIAEPFLRIGLAVGSTTILNNQVGDITIPHIQDWIVVGA